VPTELLTLGIKRRESVLLLQLDGKTPNLALMKLSAWHRGRGDRVNFRRAPNQTGVNRSLDDEDYTRVYGSLIFEGTRPLADHARKVWPNITLGGTGLDETIRLPADVEVMKPDYTPYKDYPHSIGFTQRGCRLNCPFCKVPKGEGKNKPVATVADIWRGDPYPKNLLLLDNDFFGQPEWRKRIEEMKAGGFRVCFNQGFNVRLIGDEEAAAIAGLAYYDDQFKDRRLYTAWDNRKDADRLFRNLEVLKAHGVKPDHIMVYMLVGYWDGPRITENDHYRRERLREFGCRPYPMPYVRNAETRGFQRWVVGAYDKRVAWADWVRAKYEPRNLGSVSAAPTLF
jgi:hypothetical protein